ncbi:MAG: lipopolysaccharide heptosyltransferase II [Candidatus Omnitrophota bacterium]|jgi:heptosyltransferase-2|nr:MAG: lipopolysaccharide heptosyltransferase II [Candidatus Omnitrophota bacterium]
MPKDKQVKKILFITLSNIGDNFLSLPVLDTLKECFPLAQIHVMAALRPKEIFENNPLISKVIAYDKHSRLSEKMKLFGQLQRERYDIVIDLRNSLFGALLPARYRISPFLIVPKDIKHMNSRHLYKVKKILLKIKKDLSVSMKETVFFLNPEDKARIKKILLDHGLFFRNDVVVVSAGARSYIKRWPKEKFTELITLMIKEFGVKVVLVGDKDDEPVSEYIASNCPYPVLNLTGQTNIAQLAYLLKRARFLITNDSAPLHIVSYLNVPVVAIFGPTNEEKYGPWSDNYSLAKKDISCRPCEKADCSLGSINCMNMIRADEVLRLARKMIVDKFEPQDKKIDHDFKRILIVRTDRIGDVVLSTPVIKNLRNRFPSAYIAMVVSPQAKEIIDNNPYLDEVILYDKDKEHKGWQQSMEFAGLLAKKKFDIAIILHPTNRMHLLTFLAKIPVRVGYDKKMGFLLSKKIKHTKQLGQKHELEYNLDLLKAIGINAEDKELIFNIRPEVEIWARHKLMNLGVKDNEKVIAIHPSASCPSKIWPHERFAQLADKLIEKYSFKVLIVAAAKDNYLAEKVMKEMYNEAINLSGETSVSQLAAILKRSVLFISNDSGPVHVASAVNTPVISIFGRNQAGLSPKRWAPVGKKDKVLHKEVGCIQCLAHNCKKNFACLRAIGVEDVIRAVEEVLAKQLL